MSGMRIEADKQRVSKVVLYLSPSEASELRDGLEDLLEGHSEDPGWHCHVPSADFQTEITITPHL